MVHKSRENITGENVKRYRESLGLSQSQLAKAVEHMTGISCTQQIIGHIERGRVAKSGFLPYIALVLNVKISTLNPALDDRAGLLTAKDYVPELFRRDDEVDEVFYHPLPLSAPKNTKKTTRKTKTKQQVITIKELNEEIPIYETVDLTSEGFIIAGTPTDFMPRPHVVKLEKDAFGVTIGIRNLEPALRIGNTIILHPRRLPKTGDLCMFINNDKGICTIGELIYDISNDWTIKQYNPPQNKNLPKNLWKKHYVIAAIIL